MEEYGPTIFYHLCMKNVITNTFSWLPHHDVLPVPVGKNAPDVFLDFTSKDLDINDPDMLKCFHNLPLPNITENNPVDLEWIHTQRNIGTEHTTKATKYPKQHFNNCIDGHELFVRPSQMKISWHNKK